MTTDSDDARSPRPGPSGVRAAFEAQLTAVAASDVTVLLTGESGTGKSSAARSIHAASPRSGGPLVELHLGAVSPTLIESELFGHERGAFTDARKDRIGCFRQAEGGTVVLDDVDLLPLEAQVKLLRALQERMVEPVGAEAPVAIDVRFIATTNRDLRAEVERGTFREDLYYRLAVVPLELPPLRARAGEIPELAALLLQRTASRLGRSPRPLTESALARLVEHAWPGNVRELENALERVQALVAGDHPIEPDELMFLDEASAGLVEDIARSALANGIRAEELQRALLDEALRLERGNVSAAARRVGLTRRAFEYRSERDTAGDEQ
ncbi:MAG: sigma 54-interacting transcriptional regulator [Planctomycetota bacterium]|jgi:two-component system response regulator HydG